MLNGSRLGSLCWRLRWSNAEFRIPKSEPHAPLDVVDMCSVFTVCSSQVRRRLSTSGRTCSERLGRRPGYDMYATHIE